MNVIHFFSQERVYNLKVCFATKIIIYRLLVGGGHGVGEEGKDERAFSLGLIILPEVTLHWHKVPLST